jgi:hypothetical protein
MSHRERLPNRRQHEIIDFELDGFSYRASVARYADGRLAELFLDAGKIGSAASTAARDGAIAVSIALQYGAPVETLRHAMTKLRDGSSAGPIGRALDIVAGDDQ